MKDLAQWPGWGVVGAVKFFAMYGFSCNNLRKLCCLFSEFALVILLFLM
jgi:hypothetical protein